MNKKFFIGSLIALTAFSSGCLKDDKYSEIDKTGAIVEFPIGGPGVVENSYDVTDISKNLDTTIAINIASPQPLDRDVKITVRVTPTIVTEYNTVHGTTYTPLPANVYSIEDYTITIPKGYRIGRFKVKFLFPQFSLSETYAFALQIVDAPGLTISGNYNKFLWVFNLRNQYDGLYTLRSRTVHPTNATLVGPVGPYTGIPLVTVSSNGVIWGVPHPWANGSNSQLPAGYEPTLTVLPNNSVNVTNPGVGAENIPGSNNRYVPATKTFYAAWRYMGGGGFREFYDTLIYTGPR